MTILDDKNFAAETANGNVLVDFWAEWCGPCKMIAPVLEQIDSELDNVKIGKLDVDGSAQSAMKYQVRSIPTLVFLKDGVEVDRVSGALPKILLMNKINEVFNV